MYIIYIYVSASSKSTYLVREECLQMNTCSALRRQRRKAPRSRTRIRLVATPTNRAEHHQAEELEETKEPEEAKATRPTSSLSINTEHEQEDLQAEVDARQVALPMECAAPTRAGKAAATAASEHSAIFASGIRKSSRSLPSQPSSRPLLTARDRRCEGTEHTQTTLSQNGSWMIVIYNSFMCAPFS